MAKTAQSRRVDAALRKLEKPIRDAFKIAIERASFQIDFAALVQAINAGDVARAAQIAAIDPAVLFPVEETVRAAYMEGGAVISKDFPRGLAGSFSFNGRHERAEAWVREHVGQLIQGIQAQSLGSVRQIIEEGIQTGRSSSSIARDITGRKVGQRRVGGVLGLNTDQAESLARARAILSDPAPIREYFIRDRETGRMRPRYRLSDRRFDRTITKAIREGRAITGTQLEEIMQAHKTKALGYRGRVIAKDQSFTALAAGRAEGYQQLMDNPDVETVTVRWQHNLSQNPREDHVAMDGTVIELGDFFRFDDAMMKHPHDPAGGAEHSIGCRCVAIYRVVMRRVTNRPSSTPAPAPAPAPAPRPAPIVPPVPRRSPDEPRRSPSAPTVDATESIKTVAQAETFLIENGITEAANLSGMSVQNMRQALRAAADVKTRFNLAPLSYVGRISRDNRFRYRQPKNANAAVYHQTKALHLPVKFGTLSDAKKQIESKIRNAPSYKEQRDRSITADRVAPEVRDRAAQMGEFDYTWSITRSDPAEERAKTMIHEFGHVIHLIDRRIGEKIDQFLREEEPIKNGWSYLVSAYAGSNSREYVAETFALYMTAPESQHFRIHPRLLAIYRQEDSQYVDDR